MQEDARHEAIVRMLLDRQTEDRSAREKRLLGYRQSLQGSPSPKSRVSDAGSPTRLYRFRTNVPCTVTPEARALLDQLGRQFPGGTITFPQNSREQAVMLTAGNVRKQIGWVEQTVDEHHHGLLVEADGNTLILQFRYPPTGVRLACDEKSEERIVGPDLISHGVDELTSLDFTEIRPALDLRTPEEGASPRLVWVTRPEADTMDDLGSRDYEAFYVRLKLEVQAGVWTSLANLLATAPRSAWHLGSYYTVVLEPDAPNGRIHQRTVDDSGNSVDIGLDCVYDAPAATDILLLYLEADILADFADIYFTLQGLNSTDAAVLREDFFAGIRRFWAATPSLAARYGSELATVMRMSQRAVPAPAQAPLLKQDWTALRQVLIDRYGEGGRNAAGLAGRHMDNSHSATDDWPFAFFPAGEVNVGLRVVYRQEWRSAGARRGQIISTVPPTVRPIERGSTMSVETTIEHGATTRSLEVMVAEAADATLSIMRWPREIEGSISLGARGLAATTGIGVESQCRESSRDTCMRLSDIMQRMVSTPRDAGMDPRSQHRGLLEAASGDGIDTGEDAATRVYSRLQNLYEMRTRPAEIQNIVMVAEEMPAPAEIGFDWVKRHDWILATSLLDESFREALYSISAETANTRAASFERLDAASGTAIVRADSVDQGAEWKKTDRQRFYEHLRANILHYQRAIWQHEDPEQRSMRYRKSGRKVPLDWRFELESSAEMSMDEFGERLTAPNVDGQFAAYSTGREADLDQVIDPAGPIGHYGNYSIYRMRPEFGSADLFSMLHFFKSPYLRPDPEVQRPAGTRRIALDTDSIVVDVIRVATTPAGIELEEAPEGYQLILEGGHELDLLRVAGHVDRSEEWTIPVVADMAGGRAIAGWSCAQDPESALISPAGQDMLRLAPVTESWVTPAPCAGAQTPVLRAGASSAATDRQVVIASAEVQISGGLLAGASAYPPDDPKGALVSARADGDRSRRLSAGAGARAAAARPERTIAVEDVDGLSSLVAGGRTIQT